MIIIFFNNILYDLLANARPYAAQQAVEDAVAKAKEHGIKELGVKIQGPGSGRETAVKSLGGIEGIKILWFKDVTPLPHNGCRPPKRRRV